DAFRHFDSVRPGSMQGTHKSLSYNRSMSAFRQIRRACHSLCVGAHYNARLETLSNFMVLIFQQRLILTLRIFAPWRLCVRLAPDADGLRKGAKPQRKTAK